jgi:hypothetical protein
MKEVGEDPKEKSKMRKMTTKMMMRCWTPRKVLRRRLRQSDGQSDGK